MNNFFKHWPTILLGLAVALILILAIVTYQVNQTETAVITTLGRIEEGNHGPGLHFRWPYPFQRVYKFDNRTRCFEGNGGRLEESMTADGHNILVGIFVNYRISDARQFFRSFERIPEAEKQLNNWMRHVRNATFGRYLFRQIINTSPAEMKLSEIQQTIAQELRKNAEPYGITVVSVGINTINVPAKVSEAVFDRMIKERQVEAARFISDGTREAARIRTQADARRAAIMTEAEAKAKGIRAEGDAEAAQHYQVFQENPELAAFLRKLDSLRRIMQGRTTLVLDTNAVPFDLLKSGADNLPGGAKTPEKNR